MNTLLVADHMQHYHPIETTQADPALSAGAIMLIVLLTLAISIAVYAVIAILLSRIFKKAGIETWKAWVPVYNNWVTLELGGQKGYWAALSVVPILSFVSVIFMYMAMYNIGIKLGKEGAFVLWAIFLPPVWYIWLAVDKSTWHENATEQPTVPTHKTPKQAV